MYFHISLYLPIINFYLYGKLVLNAFECMHFTSPDYGFYESKEIVAQSEVRSRLVFAGRNARASELGSTCSGHVCRMSG